MIGTKNEGENMIKLNKQVEALEKVLEKVQAKADELQEKMDAIEDHAAYYDRDLTDAEQNRFDKYEAETERWTRRKWPN